MSADYEIAGRGSDLGIRVRGPDLGACLGAAVEGLAAFLAEVDADVSTERAEVDLEGASAEDLLLQLLDDVILRLDADGRLAVELAVDEATATRLRGQLELVALDAVEVHGVAPKAATWHGVCLRPTGDGWYGEVMLDL